MVKNLKIRSNVSSAFRVPNVPELYGGVSEGNLTTSDPCTGYSSLPANSVVAQNCRASGVPAGYRQLGTLILTTVGGNPNLKPEDARTTTIGAVWQPVGGLTMTLDYYDIKISNAIQSVPGSVKLSVCYDSPGLSHLFCGPASFTRNAATGDINFLSSQPLNAASERLSGFDIGALYDFRYAGFLSSVGLDVSRLQRYEVEPFPGAEQIVYTGKTTGGRGSYAKWKALASARVARGQWSGAYTVQYLGPVDDINAAPGDIGARAPGVYYHSAQLKFAVNKTFDMAVGVDNLFDRKAPYVQSYTDANTDTMTYDLLGRRWYVKAAYHW